MRSLRRALAVRFSLTMIVALALIALWVYVGTRWRLERELDAGLTAAMHLQSAALARGLPIAFQPESADLSAFIQRVNRFVTVRDSGGRVITANTPFAGSLPLETVSFRRARDERQTVLTSQAWANHQIRALYAPTPAGSDGSMAVIQVAGSLEPLADANRNILFFTVGTVILGAVATFFGAAWLADSTVAPVTEITDHAKQISGGTLDRRITAHADVREFQGLVRVLNEMLDRLEGALRTQRRMIADVGHDLRTPITAMTGQLEVALRSDRTPDEYRRILESCLEDARHMESIGEALLMLARLDAEQLRPELSDTDLEAVAREAVARVQARAETRPIAFHAPDTGRRTKADAGMVRVVLDHLLDNSIKHTPPGTHIFVSVNDNGDRASIAVEDDGPGIPGEDLPLLVERFYRRDAARTRDTGAGLGLTIAAAIAEAHGGRLDLSHSTHGGLKIELILPQS